MQFCKDRCHLLNIVIGQIHSVSYDMEYCWNIMAVRTWWEAGSKTTFKLGINTHSMEQTTLPRNLGKRGHLWVTKQINMGKLSHNIVQYVKHITSAIIRTRSTQRLKTPIPENQLHFHKHTLNLFSKTTSIFCIHTNQQGMQNRSNLILR